MKSSFDVRRQRIKNGNKRDNSQHTSNGGNARTKPQTDPTKLEGKFFHTFEDDKWKWQGCVLSQPAEGYFLVQLFEAVLGEPSSRKVIHIGEMTDWTFYRSEEEWREEGYRRIGLTDHEIADLEERNSRLGSKTNVERL